MKPGYVLLAGVGCAIRDRGQGDWHEAFDALRHSDTPYATALKQLAKFGLKWDEIVAVFEEYDRLCAKHVDPNPLDDSPPSTRPTLYERAPRTKKYGPMQDPSRYMSAEKLRVYNLAWGWVDGEPTQRLSEDERWPLVREVFRRDQFTCTYCGADGETYKHHCDHVVPISRGGSNDIENLTTACDYCNCSKRDALPHEWRPLMAVPQ